jgi:hypothetical protein
MSLHAQWIERAFRKTSLAKQGWELTDTRGKVRYRTDVCNRLEATAINR